MSPKYLIMVMPDTNNNKFYRMTPHGNTWTAEYGRVGATGVKKDYPISMWYDKLDEKLRKGYQDVSDLHSEDKVVVSREYKEIPDKVVEEFVTQLQTWARNMISSTYTIKVKEVTKGMTQKAQNYVDQLTLTSDVKRFNSILLDLFAVLPRKMSSVADYLAKEKKDFVEIIEREQNVLDVMKSQVNDKAVNQEVSKSKKDCTILEAFGLTIRPCTDKENQEIKNHLTAESEGRFRRAFKVENKRTEKAFKEYCDKNKISRCNYLYHGSRNENIWGITSQGMSLNPNAVVTGKMFGYGLYFASRAQKSLAYTSCGWRVSGASKGILAIFKVATGKSEDVYAWKHEYSHYREVDVRKKDCDSLFAHKGSSLVNDEIIVYNEAAATIRYLVEVV